MFARAGPILRRLPKKAVLVEVGVFNGLMAEHLLRERPGLTWHGVDNWVPAERQPRAYAATGDVHARLTAEQQLNNRLIAKARVRRFGERAVVHHAHSLRAARLFEPGSVDAVYLDADHSRVAVEADIAAWWPVVRPGGWLGGHDYAHTDPQFSYGVQDAVDAWVARTGLGLELDEGFCWFVGKP